MAEYLYTKNEMQSVLKAWRINKQLPKKNEKVIITFAPPAILNVATITWTVLKGVYGKRLYRVIMERK